MLRLYSGSGSQEIQLEQRVPEARWQLLKRNACRFLIDSGDRETAKILENTPFEMWSGTNGFGDDFELLYLRADTKTYLELEKQVDNEDLWAYGTIAHTLETLGTHIRFIGVDVEVNDDDVGVVAPPKLTITSAVVERALTDAEVLVHSSGAVSGLDRVHTSFHGYLKAVCKEAGLTVTDDPKITELFKLIRTKHPAFASPPPGGTHIEKILGTMAVIVDSLNPLRNRSSIAHPNEELLEEPEAMLFINSVRTLLHYLNSRIRG